MFLKNCGSGDILLKLVKVEHEEMPEAKNVVAVLEEFMKEALTQSFWSHILRELYCEVMQALMFEPAVVIIVIGFLLKIIGNILDFFILYF